MPYGKYTRKQPMGRRKKASKAKVSVPVKNAIVRAVRQAHPTETKFATLWDGQQSVSNRYGVQFNATIGTGSNYALVPEIPLGTQVGERSGNKISPKKMVVDFWICATNYLSAVDLVARLFILESLNIKDTAQINTIDMSTLLDYGQAQGPFQGFASQLHGAVNRDQFKVHMDRTFKLQKGYGQGPNLVNAYLGNVEQPTTFYHCRVTLKCPKVLHYRDGAATLPDGWAPFFNAGYCVPSMIDTDGVDVTNSRIQVSWTSTLYYTDA